MMNDKQVFKQDYAINKEQRNALNGHYSLVVWFTGLSGSGKSTLANEIEIELNKREIRTYILDGDNLRKGLNKDLSFSDNDRKENIRRVAEVSKILMDAGTVVLSAFITPFENDRELIKLLIGSDHFIEIFVDCPLEVCEKRDTKGLYEKARNGEILNFTGISSAYEIPKQPNLTINTSVNSVADCTEQILNCILKKILMHE
jgi:adenylyl-sulfate kinase